MSGGEGRGIDELHGVGDGTGVVVGVRLHLGEFGEICLLKNLSETGLLLGSVLEVVFESLDKLRRGALKSLNAKAGRDVTAERVGQVGIELLDLIVQPKFLVANPLKVAERSHFARLDRDVIYHAVFVSRMAIFASEPPDEEKQPHDGGSDDDPRPVIEQLAPLEGSIDGGIDVEDLCHATLLIDLDFLERVDDGERKLGS